MSLSPELSRRIALAFEALTSPERFEDRQDALADISRRGYDSWQELPDWIRDLVELGESLNRSARREA